MCVAWAGPERNPFLACLGAPSCREDGGCPWSFVLWALLGGQKIQPVQVFLSNHFEAYKIRFSVTRFSVSWFPSPPDFRHVGSMLSPLTSSGEERKRLFLEELSSASKQPERFEPGGQQLVQVFSGAAQGCWTSAALFRSSLWRSPFLFPLSNHLSLPQKRKGLIPDQSHNGASGGRTQCPDRRTDGCRPPSALPRRHQERHCWLQLCRQSDSWFYFTGFCRKPGT